MKIISTTICTSAALCLFGWLLFGSNIDSVVKTSLARTRSGVESKLSHEFRVDQAELQLKEADGEISRQEKRVAELRVQCGELARDVTDLRAKVEVSETEFVHLDEALVRTGGGARPVAYGSRLTAPEDLKADLERVAFTITAATGRLAARLTVLESQQASLDKAEQMLRDIRNRRERVALAIGNSRIDLESVRLLQSASGHDVDASSLAAAEALATELAHDMSVEREFMAIQDHGAFAAGLTTMSSAQTVAQVRDRLDRAPVTTTTMASASPTRSGFQR